MTAAEFNETWLPLGDAFYRVALYILESGEDARDEVQELFVKLWNDRDSLDSVHNPKAYGITLIRNRCIDRLRKVSVTGRDRMPEDVCSESDTGRQVEDRERITRIMRHIEALPERERQVFRMKILEELTYDEITARTGMSNLTLRVLLSNARRKLRKVS